jgi:hypothetical protein
METVVGKTAVSSPRGVPIALIEASPAKAFDKFPSSQKLAPKIATES